MKKTLKSREIKVALVYDRINKWGGAERILLLLHEMFPKAPVYTSVYEKSSASWAKKIKIHTSFLQSIPVARKHHEFFALLMPKVFESFDFSAYDLVISLTSESAKGIKVNGRTKHLCICLTPTRYLWSDFNTYFPNKFIRLMIFPFIYYLKNWDIKAASNPHKIIAISKNVQKRIRKYYHRESEVMYPPLFLKGQSAEKKGEYYIVVSRLSRFSPHKKIELAIDAFNKLQFPLKVVGKGDVHRYKKLAGKTVDIVGGVTDEKLLEYYKNCKGLVFPGVEDFGLVMVEALSFGKPVLAYKAGGALEIVQEGKNGMFFSKQNTTSLVNALKLFDKGGYNRKDCVASSRRFSKKMFTKSLQEHIKELLL